MFIVHRDNTWLKNIIGLKTFIRNIIPPGNSPVEITLNRRAIRSISWDGNYHHDGVVMGW